jgi:hypothetical protein
LETEQAVLFFAAAAGVPSFPLPCSSLLVGYLNHCAILIEASRKLGEIPAAACLLQFVDYLLSFITTALE